MINKPKRNTNLIFFIGLPVLISLTIILNFYWSNKSAFSNYGVDLLSEKIKSSVSGFVSFDNIDGFISLQLTKTEELDRFTLSKLSDGNRILSIYDMNQKEVKFILLLYPEIKNLPDTQQKVFYYQESTKSLIYLDNKWLSFPENAKIQDVREYVSNQQLYWITQESNRLVISKPFLQKAVAIKLMDSTNKELIISEISAISENEVCVKLVDNLSDKPKKESCFEIKPDGENKQS
jgi:hypothetical protein